MLQSQTDDLCVPFMLALAVTGVSISVFDAAGHQSRVASTDAVAARIDEAQFELGEGPQWETVRTGRAVLIPDVKNDAHRGWPVFGETLRALDVGALFAIPMVLSRVCVGAVGLYRQAPGDLARGELAAATSMAAAVAAPAVSRVVSTADDDDAWESATTPSMRREVHQAAGMILVQLDTTASVAYSRLQAYAFATGRTVQDVANDVVNRRLNFRDLP